MLRSSDKEKLLEINLEKLEHFYSEADFQTPSKDNLSLSMLPTSTKASTSKKQREKSKRRVHKSIVEGMLYLLKHEALRHPNISDEEFKRYFESIIMTENPDQLTEDLVISNLLEKTRKKQVNYREMSGKEIKKRKKSPMNKKPKKKIQISQVTDEQVKDRNEEIDSNEFETL